MLELPQSLITGPFTLDDLRREQRSVERARRADIQHPHRGVHTHGGLPQSIGERCRALSLVLGSHHAFSHLTAALLWRIPLPWFPGRILDALHVVAIGERGRLDRPGVVSWETDGQRLAPLRAVDGIPVVSPADVWAQLAGLSTTRYPQLDVAWLIAMGDFLITGARETGGVRHPLCTLEELAAAAARRRGRRGAKRLREALERVRQGPDSPKETIVRVGLVDDGLPEPEIQVAVETSAGRRHADLGYLPERLLLEFQGDEHRTDRRRWLDDLTRVQLFEDAGYRTILIGDADVYPDCHALAARVARALRAAKTD